MNRKLFSKYPADVFEAPNLVQVQLDSHKWFWDTGFKELLKEVSPIEDWTSKELELRFLDYKLEEPKYDERVAREKNITYEAPLVCGQGGGALCHFTAYSQSRGFLHYFPIKPLQAALWRQNYSFSRSV